ncbi:hypothetical protein PFISCL1PPCAC_10606, partial [Pristionchus fissidentatus]
MSDNCSLRQSSRLRQRAHQQSLSQEDEDGLAADLVAVLMAQIRQKRDAMEHRLVRDFDLSGVVVEERVKDAVSNKMEKIDTSVSRLENNFVGTQLEFLLKDPQYGSPIKSKPASPTKSKAAVNAPAEVKVEEVSADTPCFSGSSDNFLTVNTSVSMPGGPDTVEKAAKQEAHTMARIAELRRSGMWSSSRLPLCVEPPRNKTHWDYVLEEVKWMANDFRQERIWKRGAARKLATTIARQRREKEMEIEKAEIRAIKDERRSCAMIAKMIRDFWINVDKVVDHRKQTIIESKKRKALDQHLQFIVGEADKLSQVVAEGIVTESSSKTPSLLGKGDDQDDKDFSSDESESDDETTIAKEERQLKNEDVKGEVDALGREADMDMDDVLANLPPEYLAAMGYSVPSTSKETVEEVKEEDAESESDDEDMDSDDEPLIRPTTSESVAEKETKEEEEEDEPAAKKIRKEEEEGGGGDDSDDEPLAEKMRRSREKTGEEITKVDDEEGPNDREVESQEKVKLDNVDFAKLKSDNSDERQLELTHIAEEALKFQPKGYTLETTQVKTAVPHMLRGTLREYQMVGLDWLVTLYDKNLNGILADEMGLGKTIQTVALLAHLACVERIWGPHLIVVPTSVILNWEMEFKKWCPALKILTYFGSVKERAEKRKGWMKDDSFHVCITSYKVITTDIRSFKMRSWQYLILDEAQNIKNWKSQRWQTLLNVRARRRLLLTGTPLQNSLMELWSLLHFLMPAIFASHDDFKDWFSNPLTGMMEGSVEFNKGLLDRLHKVLRPFILRRMKAEVEKQLPAKTEHVVKCPLSKRQRYLYDDFMSQRATRDNLKSGNMMSVLNIVMQLRKCCNHPNLFTPREEQTPFVVPPIKTVLPACVFDIVTDDPQQDGVKEIPASLNLANRRAAWRTDVPPSRPLVEDLDSMESSIPIPRVPGFKFVRTMAEKSIPQPSRAPEMFLVVEEGNDIGGLLKERVQVTVDGDKVHVNTDGKLGADRIRVCQGVPGGSFHDVGSESDCSIGPRRTSWKGSGGLPPPPMSTREIEPTASVSSTSIDSKRSSTSVYSTRRPVASVHSPIRSSTVLHPQSTVRTLMNGDGSSKGGRNFHETMQEGSLEPISQFPIPLSPPLKRRKVDRPLVTGPYRDLVSKERMSRLEEERRGRLEKAVNRFDDRKDPFYSWQMMSVLWREIRTRRNRGDEWSGSFWEGEWEEVQEILRKEMDQMTKSFVIYVDGALAEGPTVCVSSRGRSSYARIAQKNVQLRASRFLTDCDPLVDRNLVAHRMQFPELRLIEYDCGKLQILAKLLRELYIYKHRCLIFTQMSRMLDVLQAFLSHHGYQYFRLDGTTGIEQRQAMMERFNADSRIFCFILSTRSGGVGVNLTGADTVIFYDSDWNPTMDAQAQDRCHRIGQTRNVSIYRLISEKTIEENILKKAMQKRRLGEMAIDEAGFTPDFFRQKDNIRDLFDGENVEELEVDTPVDAPANQMELDKAMASLEDEQDVAAAKNVNIEAKADIKEFDERMGGVTVIGGVDEGELGELLGQLKPIEKYAIKFLEAEYKPEFEEEVKEAEALLLQKKREWNRAHEKAMRDEEDMDGGDPSLSTLNRDLVPDEDFHDFDVLFEEQFMPTWRPLTPPLSDLDEELYSNELTSELYDDYLMEEHELPSNIIELHRPLNKYTSSPTKKQREHSAVLELLNAASPLISAAEAAEEAQKQAAILSQTQSNASIGVPSPTPVDSPSVRRVSSSTKKATRSIFESALTGRTTKGDMRRPTTPPPADREAKDYEGPEWTILEDYALLQAVLSEQRLTHMTLNEKSGIKLNWEYISGFVNRVTGNYRSPRQCSVHYQMSVLPREEGRILTIDPLSKKTRKLSLSTNELAHMRKGRTNTHMQYICDAEGVLRDKLMEKMRAVKRVREKREPPFVRVNPHEIPSTGFPPSGHLERLSAFNIDPSITTPSQQFIGMREERRSMVMSQEKEQRARHEAIVAIERERLLISSSVSSIIVRPSAVSHGQGVLITPPLIQLDLPPPSRSHLPPPSSHSSHPMGVSLPLPSQQQPLPPPNPPLVPLPQHPMAEHMPSMGGMSRRVGPSMGGDRGVQGGMGGPSQGAPPSSHQYLVVSSADGSHGGGQQSVARMQGVMSREGNGGPSSGGVQQQVYRAMSGGTQQKRTIPAGMSRMSGYVGGPGEGGPPPGQAIHVSRGQPVGRNDMRVPFNAQRVAQRVMPGGGTSRVYMSPGGNGTQSGGASPSQGGQQMTDQSGGGGGSQSGQPGRTTYMMPPPHTVRVGIQPPRMTG